MKNKSTLLLAALSLFPTAVTQAAPQPAAVHSFRGKFCSAMGPQGWAVIAENPQRSAFGADVLSPDGVVSAGYAIWGGGALTHLPGDETPDRAVARNITRMGSLQTNFGKKQQIGPNVFLLEFQNSNGHGVAFWQVIPTGPGGFMIVLRTAETANTQGLWQKRAAEAMAVARSLHCQVPNVPAAPDPPGLNGTKPKSHGGDNADESDPLYNQWLDKEYYHNSQTGENFWVSPNQDWLQNGPQGPGYYAQHGNSTVKLDPGYAQ
jgi:hypothetical protein